MQHVCDPQPRISKDEKKRSTKAKFIHIEDINHFNIAEETKTREIRRWRQGRGTKNERKKENENLR